MTNTRTTCLSFGCVICLGIQQSEVSALRCLPPAGYTSPVFGIHTSVRHQPEPFQCVRVHIHLFFLTPAATAIVVVVTGTPESRCNAPICMLCLGLASLMERGKQTPSAKCEWRSVVVQHRCRDHTFRMKDDIVKSVEHCGAFYSSGATLDILTHYSATDALINHVCFPILSPGYLYAIMPKR